MDEKEYCIDIFTPERRPWMDDYRAKKVNGKYGAYYTVTVDAGKRKEVLKKCRGIKTRCYESCWARSSGYRAEFIKANPGPYVCSYCGKPLSERAMVVDHVIPVEQAKKSPRARRKLKRRGISNVNDTGNLAAACKRCNKRKADKMGFWLVRAKYGKYKAFRITCRTLIVLGLAALALLVYFGLSV